MNLWDNADVPHKGWTLIDNFKSKDDEICEMCGKENIRYVFQMCHLEYERILLVGCICAEKMTNDYITPRKAQREMQNLDRRRKDWPFLKAWKVSIKKNFYLKKEEHLVIVTEIKNKWMFSIDGIFAHQSYSSLVDAQLGAFDRIYVKRR